jgi:hypothetical protein
MRHFLFLRRPAINLIRRSYLSGEGRVAVQQDGHDLLSFLVSAVELFGADLALNHGVAGLQVGRVGDHSQPGVNVMINIIAPKKKIFKKFLV